jgi:hypothetical protein
MKQIAYTVVTEGIDGREPTQISAAFWTEEERDTHFKGLGANSPWYRKDERIVDIEQAKRAALAKLNGIDKLVLEIKSEPPKIPKGPINRVSR